MAFIAFHPLFCHPLPAGHRFPMLKYELLPQQLVWQGIAGDGDFFEPDAVALEHVVAAHDSTFVAKLMRLELSPPEVRRMGFPLTKQLVERELRIVEGTIRAAEQAQVGGIGFNIAGGTHHAGSDWAEGFCLLNDQAVAARYMIRHHGLRRVLIVDLDVHQGNGTAEIFQNDDRVFTFSMHGKNNFPFKKERSDLDIDLDDHLEGSSYRAVLSEQLQAVFSNFRPEFVFYQSGVDVLSTDKMGKMNLSLEDCRLRDRIVFELCKASGVPVQVSMGGGYSPQIKTIVDAHAQTFEEGIRIYR